MGLVWELWLVLRCGWMRFTGPDQHIPLPGWGAMGAEIRRTAPASSVVQEWKTLGECPEVTLIIEGKKLLQFFWKNCKIKCNLHTHTHTHIKICCACLEDWIIWPKLITYHYGCEMMIIFPASLWNTQCIYLFTSIAAFAIWQLRQVISWHTPDHL